MPIELQTNLSLEANPVAPEHVVNIKWVEQHAPTLAAFAQLVARVEALEAALPRGPTTWDSGATVWDRGVWHLGPQGTIWDAEPPYEGPTGWDAGLTQWDNGTTTWN